MLNNNCSQTIEKNTVFFENKSSVLLKLMEEYGTKETFSKKTTIVYPGDYLDNFYYIINGRVKYTVTSEEGIEKVFMVLENGAFFGEGPIIMESPSVISAVVYPKTTLYKLNAGVFKQLLEYPPFRTLILKSAYQKISILMKEIENLSFNTCKDRLLNLLVALVKEEEVIDSCWYKLRAKYTQQELANIVGASRVTVAKLISELCDEGQIRILNRQIHVHKDAVL